MARKTKKDWYWACAQIVSQDGALALTIDRLCQAVGLTKGSFYHHFGGIDDFIEQYLLFFEQEGTLQIIETVEIEITPAAKMRKLIELVIADPPDLEAGTRAWALQDSRVQAVFERVDQQRFAYVTELWRPLVADEATAILRGRMLYTILIGGNHVFPPLSQSELRALFNAYLEAFEI